jgi:hypothetical protein
MAMLECVEGTGNKRSDTEGSIQAPALAHHNFARPRQDTAPWVGPQAGSVVRLQVHRDRLPAGPGDREDRLQYSLKLETAMRALEILSLHPTRPTLSSQVRSECLSNSCCHPTKSSGRRDRQS